MVKINDETREIMNQEGKYFQEGVHEVIISEAKRGASQSGSEFIEVTVVDPNEPSTTGTAKLYVTDKAAPYTLKTLQAILVHNAKEADKQKVRDYFGKLDDTDEFAESKLVDAQCWYKVERTGETYEYNGETKERYDRSIFSYEPKMKQITAADLISSGTAVAASEVPFN